MIALTFLGKSCNSHALVVLLGFKKMAKNDGFTNNVRQIVKIVHSAYIVLLHKFQSFL